MLNTDWDLSPIYSSFEEPAFARDLEWVENRCKELAAWAKEPVTDEAAWLNTAAESLNALITRFDRVNEYVFLTLSVDATHEQASRYLGKCDVLSMEWEKAVNAMGRTMARMEDFDTVMASDPKLAQYHHALGEIRKNAKHMLPENLEGPVMELQLTGSRAWANLRNTLDGTAMVEYRGEKLPLSQVRGLAYDPDPAVRKDAYEAELAAYPAYEQPMAACLNGIKGEALATCRMKGYASVLEATLDGAMMDQATLDALLGAIRKYLPAFRRYLKAKARYLGYENGLPFWELFAPVGKVQKTYTYDQAHTYLVEIMKSFSQEMSQFIDHAFTHGWIDALPKNGKGGGAFCSYVHALKESRVLTNFTGSFSDVSTLAHELGHGFHGHCLKDEPAINTNYSMPLAETASIFNETLVSQAALQTADEETAFALLEGELMEATQTVVDIYSRFLFESEVFRRREDHNLTVEELKQIMLDAQKEAYGDGLDPEHLHPYMWQNKCHYYFADLHFYNFPYAFGLLFGRGVYELYRREGAAFVPKYKELLRGTGVNNVADAAALVGIDVRDQAFWETSLASLEEEACRFERIVNQRIQ